MSTLYEILEVSENASKEVIDKAYKVLAKRYHPDLQQDADKKQAEIKMKQINEAYDVLSDDIKRKEYDQTLSIQRETEKRKNEENYKSETTYTSTQKVNKWKNRCKSNTKMLTIII